MKKRTGGDVGNQSNRIPAIIITVAGDVSCVTDPEEEVSRGDRQPQHKRRVKPWKQQSQKHEKGLS